MKMEAKYFVFIVFIGIAWAETTPSTADLLNNLPPELQGKLNETTIEEIKNKSTAAIREKCEKFGGPDAYDKLEKEVKELPKCMQESLNLTSVDELKKEIEDAKPHGAVDEVFIKYCNRTPQVKACYNSSIEAAKLCMSEDEKNNTRIIYNITEQLIDFICFKEGDRIALFIAEGGPECYEEKAEQIRECVSKTYGEEYKINTTDISANTIPEIKFGDKECKQFNDLQDCVVRALETCKAPTSANIVESLFKFIRKATPCHVAEEEKVVVPATNMNVKQNPAPGAASGLVVTSATLLMGVVSALVL